MRKSRIGVSICLSVLIAQCSLSAVADVLTPEMEDRRHRADGLEKAVAVARKSGNMQQQLAAANAFDQFCTGSNERYSAMPLRAKLELADIYWSNGQPAQGKKILATWYAGFDRAHADGMRKLAAIKARRDALKPGEFDVVTDPDELHFDMNFYKAGPGTVQPGLQLHTLVYLSELCKALGQAQESSTYLSQAGRVYSQNRERSFYSQSWAAAVAEAKILGHSQWLSLYREADRRSTSTQRVAQLKLALSEAYKYGRDNLCVAETLFSLGRIYSGAEAEPLLKQAVEIFWKNGSPEAQSAASSYLVCMRSLKREQEGRRFLDTLKAANHQPK